MRERQMQQHRRQEVSRQISVSYTHLRAHETRDIALVCGTATDKVEFNKTIAKLPAPDQEPTPNPDTKLGDITFEPVVSEDVPSVNVDTDKKKLIEKTLDD